MELDKDLRSRQEARELARDALAAQKRLASFSQEQLDRIVEAMAKAFSREAAMLAELAVRETGFGNVPDKTEKNRFASNDVAQALRDMKTVGVLREHPGGKLWEIGVPIGPIAAIVPSTNPTSTVCYKALIAVKSGNAIVFSPHPKAVGCSLRAARILAEASGCRGMVAGQVMDVTGEGSTPTLEKVDYIHRHKTADLLTAPIEAGFILAGADDAAITAGCEYGLQLGLAFQMVVA